MAASLTPLDRAVADVLAVLHAVEADALHRLVRARARHLHRVAERSDTQDPTAARHQRLAVRAGRGVEHAALVRGRRNPGDGVALARLVGIAVRRDHDAERGAAVPSGLDARKFAGERALDEF